MLIDKLLHDASGMTEGSSHRSENIVLAAKLSAIGPDTAITPKGVGKWRERGTLPTHWMLRLSTLTNPPLNPNDYA